MNNGDHTMDLIKTIKAAKEVFVEVVTENSAFWVKVYKKDLITQIQSNLGVKPEEELYVVTKYGNSSLYLSNKY